MHESCTPNNKTVFNKNTFIQENRFIKNCVHTNNKSKKNRHIIFYVKRIRQKYIFALS